MTEAKEAAKPHLIGNVVSIEKYCPDGDKEGGQAVKKDVIGADVELDSAPTSSDSSSAYCYCNMMGGSHAFAAAASTHEAKIIKASRGRVGAESSEMLRLVEQLQPVGAEGIGGSIDGQMPEAILADWLATVNNGNIDASLEDDLKELGMAGGIVSHMISFVSVLVYLIL